VRKVFELGGCRHMAEIKLNGCIIEKCKIRTECNLAYGCENPPCAGDVEIQKPSHNTASLKLPEWSAVYEYLKSVPITTEQIFTGTTEFYAKHVYDFIVRQLQA
jgi:hypothetical protein